MIAAGVSNGRRRFTPRFTLFAVAAAAHLVLIWLLLQEAATPVARSSDPLLRLFDLPLPPMPAAPPPPPPPLLARPGGGGSPGVRRERAAAMVERPAPPRRQAMDATLLPIAPLPDAEPAAGSASVDSGLGGLNGRGDGTGSGAGSGDGPGSGLGSGGGEDAYAHAEWIERAPPSVSQRFWPPRQQRMERPATVRLICKVRRSGRPYACRVRSETPRPLGFRTTALAILQASRVKPVTRNGDPLYDVPVLINLFFDPLEVAPRLPLTSEASAPRAR